MADERGHGHGRCGNVGGARPAGRGVVGADVPSAPYASAGASSSASSSLGRSGPASLAGGGLPPCGWDARAGELAARFGGLKASVERIARTAANAADAWRSLLRSGALGPDVPFEVHEALFESCYRNWSEDRHGARPAWFPAPGAAAASPAARVLARLRHGTPLSARPVPYDWESTAAAVDAGRLRAAHALSVRRPAEYWTAALEDVPGAAVQRRQCAPNAGTEDGAGTVGPVLDYSSTRRGDAHGGSHSETWLPGWTVNASAACTSRQNDASLAALVGRLDERGGLVAASLTPSQLRMLSVVLARGIASVLWHANGVYLRRGDSCGLCAPMNALSLASFLGLGLYGVSVVCIADSFSADEIKARIEAAEAKACVAADALPRRSATAKPIALYPRVREAAGERPVVVIPHAWSALDSRASNAAGQDGFLVALANSLPSLEVPLWPNDVALRECLLEGLALESAERHRLVEHCGDLAPESMWCRDTPFIPVPTTSSETSIILFSSGTTGKPKPIPWSQVTAIKCAYDAAFHMGVRAGDRVCWPTSFGWMMGPWLVYASLLNDATFVAFDGGPASKGFARFVESARATLVGCVPSLVAAWRASGVLDGVDLASVRCFASTGEASRVQDSLWLMSRVPGYRPIVEYCGGTEVGGGYMCGSVYAPSSPSCFFGLNVGCDVVLLVSDDGVVPYEDAAASGVPVVGEVALRPPILGSSRYLLAASGRSHYDAYYNGMGVAERGPAMRASAIGGLLDSAAMVAEQRLRRHGDRVEVMVGGYLRARGRTDDAFNLGGIKTSSLEVEAALMGGLDASTRVVEVAAVAVSPPGGGPDSLWLGIAVAPDALDACSAGPSAAGQPWRPASPALVRACASAVKARLNPLFKVAGAVVVAGALPRTASNKVLRSTVRSWCAAASLSSAPPSRL